MRDSKQDQSRFEWIDDPLTEFKADPTTQRGTYIEVRRNEPDERGVIATIFHHPDDEVLVRLTELRRCNDHEPL